MMPMKRAETGFSLQKVYSGEEEKSAERERSRNVKGG